MHETITLSGYEYERMTLLASWLWDAFYGNRNPSESIAANARAYALSSSSR